MTKPTSLSDVMCSTATTAYDRLKELLSARVTVQPVPFLLWGEKHQKEHVDTTLHPNSTTLFGDGWERYYGMGTAPNDVFTPTLELYVASHNAVYSYSLNAGLVADLDKLR
jgi:hypothetical protein